jgi:hypothetical protein
VRRGNAYVIFVGNTEGNRPLGRPRRKWECNNKMYLKEKYLDVNGSVIIKFILKKNDVIRADINLQDKHM